MAETRKLAAILAADLVGYSKLAGSDEERTLARLRALWSDLIGPTLTLHHGRVVIFVSRQPTSTPQIKSKNYGKRRSVRAGRSSMSTGITASAVQRGATSGRASTLSAETPAGAGLISSWPGALID